MTTAFAAKTDFDEIELVHKSKHFTKMLQTVEILHRRFLDVITSELGRRDKALSAVQALILCHANERSMSLGQLQAIGQYEGTNLTYNVTKLAEGGYVKLSRPQWDKRSSLIELTEEGRQVAQVILCALDIHADSLAGIGISTQELMLLTRALKDINHLWSN
ncbi:MarR family winged helix-turn-helix transcriptional regulator [Aestuariivirga sp. YIM B02566]|uniref:Winged helix DNA-binding protein n=1 Tax=Taklimakanibacter albus TaxID=2800327 RepID=A0ACC5RBW3_9HYPH|nr:winged helix DNA-binding protein [Aestuariivirga sp. YIM B02566]MBK1870107.1 winged helix DNA-binding protein [Aestuariivirga sp. YIM B02566]